MMKSYFLIPLCFITVLFSCTENKQKARESKPGKKAPGRLVTDSIAPPLVTPISPAKRVPATITSKPFSLDPRMGKEAITTITAVTGLPLGQYANNGFVQDNNGNLWFHIRTSLIKYDGHNFIRYPLVPGKNVSCDDMALDSNNELWVAITKTDSAGTAQVTRLYIFNGTSFEQLPVKPSGWNTKKDMYGMRLFPQTDGTIWVVTDEHKQILKFKGRELEQTITLKDFSFNWIYDIKTDRLGDTWFIDSSDTTLTRFDGDTFQKLTRADGLPKTRLYSTLPFSADSIYLTTNNGSYFYNGRKSTRVNDNSSSGFLLDKQGTLWLEGDSDGGVVDKISSAGLASFKREDGLGVSEFWSLGIDKDDNVWVMSQNSVNRLYKPVTTYGDVFPGSRFYRGIRTFYNDRNDRYWFGSYFNGASCYNGKTLTNYSFPNNDAKAIYRTDNHILDFTEDKAGNIWISTFKGSLIKFDGKSFFINDKTNGFSEKLLFEILADSKGNIWFVKSFRGSLVGGGVAYFNGKETVRFTTAQGLCSNDVYCLFEDGKGVMWFGTQNGLSRLKDGRFTTFNVEDGLTNTGITEITEDAYGNLWLGTDGGLSRYDGERFVNYTTENGLVSNAIIRIQKDSVNNLFWLQSEVGFTAMTIKANHPDSVVFKNYSEAEGFPLKSTFSSFMVDSQGSLLTSEGNNSIKRFDYKKVKENSKPFNLHLTQIRLNNEAICWSNLKDSDKDSLVLQMEMQIRFGKLMSRDGLEQMARQFSGVRYDSIIAFDFIPYNLSLPYKANSISFDFAAIDPHFSNSTRYQHNLEGFDKTWSPLSKSTNANFGNLREGGYTFRLKALNPYGKWSEMSYSFKVLPPWHRAWWAYGLYVVFFMSGIYLFIRWRTKALLKEKIVLEEKVTTRTSELNQSLQNLKSTQNQLIQSEKMASLGELTAGIAHEIQNPLNFVNNFSEVNTELISEMKEALMKGNVDEARAIADSIDENENKIVSHGKRADAIVKGMLQHSRSSSGVKEPTDINALADEYLRLAYHGLRAKDKSFNATLKTDFDQTIDNINIIPQDIGRVILNLITNAFYAVNEKKSQGSDPFEPTVTVRTKRIGDKVLISVKDNGNGIPQKALDKIFQPFFTTKPTGQGTGLGLSMSYDIVKAHGGDIKVNTKENEGSEFVITLPC